MNGPHLTVRARSLALRQRRAVSTPQHRRALDAAEVILEATGLRYQSLQILGLAHILIAFAENERRLASVVEDDPDDETNTEGLDDGGGMDEAIGDEPDDDGDDPGEDE